MTHVDLLFPPIASKVRKQVDAHNLSLRSTHTHTAAPFLLVLVLVVAKPIAILRDWL